MNLETLTLPLQVSHSAFNAGLKIAAAGVTALVAGMTVAVKATFDWANDLDKLGDVMGGTNEELAALNFVARKSGVSVDALARGTVILSKGLVDAKGNLDTTGKALKAWGVNVLDANGNLKDQTTLMGEIAQKYSEFGTQQEKVNFLTEVFGRGGAELIDFFDTLAAEGGIDAVTKKVEALGLAIDPNRYEQFNRNLEEMKLIGLGLAVGFTEQLMPAFEAVSEWAFTKGIPALKAFGSTIKKAFDEGGVLGVADLLLDEFDNIDWGNVSTALIDGINSVDWSQAGMDFSAFVQRVSESLSTAFSEFDWWSTGNAIASALNNFIAGMMGTDEAGLQVKVKEALDGVVLEFQTLSDRVAPEMDRFGGTVTNSAQTAGTLLGATIREKLNAALIEFPAWSARVGATMILWGSGLVSQVSNTMGSIQTFIAAKLAAISENFQMRASSWLKKAAEVFNDTKGVLISAVATLVGEINNELKKIIQSFTLTIRAVFSGGSGGSTGTTSIGSTGGGGGGGDRPDERKSVSLGGISSGAVGMATVMIGNWGDFPIERMSAELVKAMNNL